MRIAGVIILAILTTAACGDSPVGPSSGTRVEAIVQDSPVTSPTASGSLAGNVSASLWDGDRWNDLGSPNGVTIPLQAAGRSTTVHGEASVESTSYSRVRLVLQGVSARVARGSIIGGTTLSDDATIALGGTDQRAELIADVGTFSVEADPSGRRVVVFELRSQLWLSAQALQSGRVEDAALQAAVSASTRLERR